MNRFEFVRKLRAIACRITLVALRIRHGVLMLFARAGYFTGLLQHFSLTELLVWLL